jgi:hypothetical protein
LFFRFSGTRFVCSASICSVSAFQQKAVVYDRAGDAHYETISVFIQKHARFGRERRDVLAGENAARRRRLESQMTTETMAIIDAGNPWLLLYFLLAPEFIIVIEKACFSMRNRSILARVPKKGTKQKGTKKGTKKNEIRLSNRRNKHEN